MHVLIVNNSRIPAIKYGGTERVIWYLGKELAAMGHKVSYLVQKGSYCNHAEVLTIDENKKIADQIPSSVDIVHFNFLVEEEVPKPYIVTIHGNRNDDVKLDINSVFVSKNHAERFGSTSYVHNGLDWNDYGKPDLKKQRQYFHFLGDAAWRIKNVQGAIKVVSLTRAERLKVLGGHRLNFRMGFRFTLSSRVAFAGLVDDASKQKFLQASKGLIFPVRWHEPFGLAIIESLYYGCPVFATPYGSLPEIVTPDAGFLSNSSEALAAAIEQSGKYNRTRCHEYALDMFNSRKMAEAYLKKYTEALNGSTLNAQKPQLIKKQEVKFLEWK